MDSECHSMVVEYLIHNCFKNTAKALLKETSKLEYGATTQKENILKRKSLFTINKESQWAQIDARKNLINAIKKGDILLAFDLINQHFPVLAAHDIAPNGIPSLNDPRAVKQHAILFKLKCQRFVEIIRSGSPTSELEAIRYAQTHLKATDSELKEKVKEVTTLIAYADPHQSKSRHLLAQERRDDLATEVNNALLVHCNLPIQTSIEKVSRQYSLVEEELAKNNNTLDWDYKGKLAI